MCPYYQWQILFSRAKIITSQIHTCTQAKAVGKVSSTDDQRLFHRSENASMRANSCANISMRCHLLVQLLVNSKSSIDSMRMRVCVCVLVHQTIEMAPNKQHS